MKETKSMKKITICEFDPDRAIIYIRKDIDSSKWYCRIKKGNGKYVVRTTKTVLKEKALIKAEKIYTELSDEGLLCDSEYERILYNNRPMSFKKPLGNSAILRGVYKIVNRRDGTVYIGMSEDIVKRWSRHKGALNRDKHRNKYLQNAWNKWGQWNFDFQIISLFKKEADTEAILKSESGHILKAIQEGKSSYNRKL